MAREKSAFQGRVALVTGGSSGIGVALARQLADQGANVWLLARQENVLKESTARLSSAHGQRHGYVVADVTAWDQVQAAVESVRREVGVPDLLINSAGITYPGYVEEIPLEIFHQVMDTNYFGTVNAVRAVLPGMLERGNGHIVNMGSVAGYIGSFGYAAYGASKFAVRGFSDVLRLELKPRGVRVSLVLPPDTDTPQLAFEHKIAPPETREINSTTGVLPADTVAKQILDGVRRRKYIILPGFENKVVYFLDGHLGDVVYPVMDAMLADARKKIAKAAKGSDGHIREGLQLHRGQGSDQERNVSLLPSDERERGD